MDKQGNVIIYQSEDGVVRLDVRLEDKTVWLTIDQMAELFGKSRSTINEHILHIYEEGELEEDKTKRKIGISDFSTKPTNFYNLDVIISVGYRVKSIQGTRFRQWATERLHEYIVKGFALDDERLKNLGGGSYWKELLDRIRDIRSSEKGPHTGSASSPLPRRTRNILYGLSSLLAPRAPRRCTDHTIFTGRLPAKISHVRFFHGRASQNNFSREIFSREAFPEKFLT